MINASRSAKDSARCAWHIDHRQLLPGDVLLETGATVFGAVIRKVDGGAYSHALMWLGNTDFIEAVAAGARVISFARVLVADPERWLLLRHPDRALALAAASEARNLAHKKYSLPKALATKLPIAPASSPTSLFCSQLVAEAYARTGEALVNGKPAGKVTPNDLFRASSLHNLGIPPMVEVRLEADDTSLLDRDRAYRESLPAIERRISQHAFAAVRRLARDLKPAPGNLAELLQAVADSADDHSELAAALLEALEERGYFSLLDGMMAEICAGEPVAATPEQVAGWRKSAQRHQQEWRAHFRLSQRSPYPLWERFAQLYLRNYQMFAALVERGTGPSAR
jgi:hypothetical protein